MVGTNRPSTAAALAIAALAAVVVMLPGIGNGFAYDDVTIVARNTGIQSLATLPGRLLEPYWLGSLYRPATLGLLGLEWIAGGGSPLLFRLTSMLLHATLAAVVVLLAQRGGAPPWAALLGGLVFAVHPVHSEVTANTVGQAELLAALMAAVAVLVYLRARQQGGPSPGATVVILFCAFLASQAKESGYTVAGLLVAAEWLVVPRLLPGPVDRSRLRVPALLLAAVLLGGIALRVSVLGGVGGEVPHLYWQGMPAGSRVLAMLAVVPEWARLLLWPVHLQAEYGPPGLAPSGSFDANHLLGLGLLVATLLLVAWGWRRSPLVAFGVTWVIIGIAPVANVAFPTGIILAERTLFLPSIGLSLAIAWGAASMAPRWSRGLKAALAAAMVALLLAAGTRTAVRQPAWRDSRTILTQTVQDAPGSYRAHFVLGKELLDLGERDAARQAFAEAARLWDRDPRPFEELGQILRADGQCAAAIPVLMRGVAADSTADVARSRLVECLIAEQRWDEAEREVRRGLGQGVRAYGDALERIGAGRRGSFQRIP